jgi:ribosome-associated translation inhibitor RaiA
MHWGQAIIGVVERKSIKGVFVMRTVIDQVGFTRSAALDAFAKQKAVSPLSRMAGRIKRIWVQFKSGDGKRHTGAHGATIQVVMRDGPTLHVDAWAGCHYAAVEQAANRARRKVVRHLGRRQRLFRRGNRRREAA